MNWCDLFTHSSLLNLFIFPGGCWQWHGITPDGEMKCSHLPPSLYVSSSSSPPPVLPYSLFLSLSHTHTHTTLLHCLFSHWRLFYCYCCFICSVSHPCSFVCNKTIPFQRSLFFYFLCIFLFWKDECFTALASQLSSTDVLAHLLFRCKPQGVKWELYCGHVNLINKQGE